MKIKYTIVLLSALLAAGPALAAHHTTVTKTTTTTTVRTTIVKKETLPNVVQEILADPETQRFGHVITYSNMDFKEFNNADLTIFVPVDSSFEKLQTATQEKLASKNRPNQFATLVRAHTVNGITSLRALHGDFNVVTASDGTRLEIKKLGLDDYYVNGRRVISRNDVGGSIIYKIDGFVVDPEKVLIGDGPVPVVTY